METGALISFCLFLVGLTGFVLATSSSFFIWKNEKFKKLETGQTRIKARFDNELEEVKEDIAEIKDNAIGIKTPLIKYNPINWSNY